MSEPNFPIVKNWGLAFPRPPVAQLLYRDRNAIAAGYLKFMDKKNPETIFNVPGACRLYGKIYGDTTRPNGSDFLSLNIDKIYKSSKVGLVLETINGKKYRVKTNKACKGFYKFLHDAHNLRFGNKFEYLMWCPGDFKNFV